MARKRGAQNQDETPEMLAGESDGKRLSRGKRAPVGMAMKASKGAARPALIVGMLIEPHAAGGPRSARAATHPGRQRQMVEDRLRGPHTRRAVRGARRQVA